MAGIAELAAAEPAVTQQASQPERNAAGAEMDSGACTTQLVLAEAPAAESPEAAVPLAPQVTDGEVTDCEVAAAATALVSGIFAQLSLEVQGGGAEGAGG